jgi:hypothetical protein
MFPSSGEGEDTYSFELISVIEISSLQWANYVGVFPLTWGRKQIQFPKSRVFSFLEYRTMEKSPNNPVILCIKVDVAYCLKCIYISVLGLLWKMDNTIRSTGTMSIYLSVSLIVPSIHIRNS